jgi:hypothetical protein
MEKPPLKRHPFLVRILFYASYIFISLFSLIIYFIIMYIRYGDITDNLDYIDVSLFFLCSIIGGLLIVWSQRIYDNYLDKIYGRGSRIWGEIKKIKKYKKPLIWFSFLNYSFAGTLLKRLGIMLYFVSVSCILFQFIYIYNGFIIIAIALLFSFGPLYSLGERISRPDAKSLLEKDSRPHVLLLRPFRTDYRATFSFFTAFSSAEDTIVPILEEIGPVISVGRPGEVLPPSGAARLYVPNEDWQEVVNHLMTSSRVVVLLLFSHVPLEKTSHLSGFTWEINQAFKLLQPQQLLLMLQAIPCSAKKVVIEKNKAYFELLQQCLEVINRKLPQSLSTEESEAGFIYFTQDWIPQVLRVNQYLNAWKYASTMRPFFQALGLPSPPKILNIL